MKSSQVINKNNLRTKILGNQYIDFKKNVIKMKLDWVLGVGLKVLINRLK